jgi:hypothetical protein
MVNMNVHAQESLKTLGMRVVASSMLTVGLACSFFFTLLAPIPLLLLFYFRGLKVFLAGQLLALFFFLLAAQILGLPWPSFLLAQLMIFFLSSLVVFTLKATRPVDLWRRFHGMLLCVFAGILFIGQLVRVSPAVYQPLLAWVKTDIIEAGKLAQKLDELKIQMPSKEVDYLVEMLGNQEKLHRLFWLELPQGIIFLLFLAAWINLLIGMRAARFQKVIMQRTSPERGEALPNAELLKHSDVVYFRNPDAILYLVIISLGPLAWHFWQGDASQIKPEILTTCYWALNMVAVSYFFQGFPLLGLSMQYLGARKGLSSFLIAITIIFSSWLVSLMGLVDHWVDLRSLIMKHLNKNGTNPTPKS